MTEKEKNLETLTNALPASWLDKDVLLALLKVLLAIKDLYEILRAKDKDKTKFPLFSPPPDDSGGGLRWEVIGDEEGKGVD